MENWKDIKGYEGIYQISNLGRVKSLEKEIINNRYKTKMIVKEKIMTPQLAGWGYLSIQLRKDGFYSGKLIHKLILDAFIPNPKNKPLGNHKDGDKLNNSLDNLEWSTHSENNKHAYDIGLKETNRDWAKSGAARSKEVVHLMTGIFYGSLKEGLEAFNIKRSTEQTRQNRKYKNINFKYI